MMVMPRIVGNLYVCSVFGSEEIFYCLFGGRENFFKSKLIRCHRAVCTSVNMMLYCFEPNIVLHTLHISYIFP